MSKLNRSEFKELLVEWKQNLLNEEKMSKYTPKYSKPNFDFEWKEAKTHHRKDFPNKDIWLASAERGEVFDVKNIEIENTQYSSDLEQMESDYKKLTSDRRKRIENMFDSGIVELPIVKKKNNVYTLIAGNTRLTMMGIKNKTSNFPVKVWLIDLDYNN